MGARGRRGDRRGVYGGRRGRGEAEDDEWVGDGVSGAAGQRGLGDLGFSQGRGVVTDDERDNALTISESRVLEALLGQPGEPLDKQELAQVALGRKLTLYDRSLDMHVSNLRKKIGPHPDGRPRIVALRSRGYYYSL